MSGNTERLNAALDGRNKIEKQLGWGGMLVMGIRMKCSHVDVLTS
jgi:hypothetical protein